MIQKIKEFFNEVKVEIKKVIYPSKEELVGSIWVVIIAVFLISVFLGVVDIGISKVVRELLR